MTTDDPMGYRERYAEDLHRMAWYYGRKWGRPGAIGMEPDDLVGYLYLAGWKALPRYDPEVSKVTTFLYHQMKWCVTKAHREALGIARTEWEKGERGYAVSLDERVDGGDGDRAVRGDLIHDSATKEAYSLAEWRVDLERLSPRDGALLMAQAFGASGRQMAKRLGLTHASLLRRLSRTRARVAEEMEGTME